VRYHEERADFSILSSARAKVVVEPQHSVEGVPSVLLVARVYLDATNGGEWKECVAEASLPPKLNAAWLAKAHIGVTASTGQLADNHDVLGLEVYSDSDAHLEAEAAPEAKYFEPGDGVSPERFERIEAQLDALIAKLEHLQHHLEHEMVAVDDHVRATIDKLQKQEDGAEARIEALEKKVVSGVEDSLAARIAKLEDAMRDAVQQRIKVVESKYMSSIHDVVGEKLASAGRGWTAPFVFLVVVDIVAAYAVYKWYIKFKKSHLL
jgi:mannose-binding lectin 2